MWSKITLIIITMQICWLFPPLPFCVCIWAQSRFRVFPFLWLPDTGLTNKSLRPSIPLCIFPTSHAASYYWVMRVSYRNLCIFLPKRQPPPHVYIYQSPNQMHLNNFLSNTNVNFVSSIHRHHHDTRWLLLTCRLAIGFGRWSTIPIFRDIRLCHFCSCNLMENEVRIVLECPPPI